MTTKMKTHVRPVERLEAGSEVAWVAVLEVMPEVTPVIRSVLGSRSLIDEVDDVAQETMISAVASAGRWDPQRGPLVAWVTSIGKRRAIDLVRKRQRANIVPGVIAGQGAAEEGLAVIDVPVPAFDDQILDRDEAWRMVSSVLAQVKLVLRNDETVMRALEVLITHDGDVAAAARAMGLAEPVVREARRETVRMAVVIRNAGDVHTRGIQIDCGAVMSCLPGEVGSWTKTTMFAALRAGGFDRARPEDIAAMTGWSVSTSRQRLADTAWLLSVARTVAEQGQITAADAVPC